jgi:hypothetical protein
MLIIGCDFTRYHQIATDDRGQTRRSRLPLTCPQAPRTESYDTRIARHDLENCPKMSETPVQRVLLIWCSPITVL